MNKREAAESNVKAGRDYKSLEFGCEECPFKEELCLNRDGKTSCYEFCKNWLKDNPEEFDWKVKKTRHDEEYFSHWYHAGPVMLHAPDPEDDEPDEDGYYAGRLEITHLIASAHDWLPKILDVNQVLGAEVRRLHGLIHDCFDKAGSF